MRYVAVSALSHAGLVRDSNEDSLVVGPWTVCSAVTHTPQTFAFTEEQPLLVAVADGLGGHPAGEVASAVAVQHLARAGAPARDAEAVRALLAACNSAVYDESERDAARTAMGTTIAGVVVDDRTVVVGNVGDSRVYVLADNGLTQLSVDDNPPLAPGETHTPVLTQMLGGHPGRKNVDVHVSVRPRAADERYLVCTDGLTDVVGDDRIAALLAEHHGARAVHELCHAALEAGGPDNVTLALVEPAAS